MVPWPEKQLRGILHFKSVPVLKGIETGIPMGLVARSVALELVSMMCSRKHSSSDSRQLQIHQENVVSLVDSNAFEVWQELQYFLASGLARVHR